MNPYLAGQGLGSIFGGLFGDSGAPYEDYENEMRKWYEKSRQAQNPFWKAGTGAIPGYQDWLSGQKDPGDFINKLMGKYQESPWAKYQQDTAFRAAQNAASTGDNPMVGGAGSTPFAQFAAQQAAGISSQDMQNWLASVLGINTQYGQGLGNLMTGGQGAANQMSADAGAFGRGISEAKYGERAGENADRNNLWGGLFGLAGSLFL